MYLYINIVEELGESGINKEGKEVERSATTKTTTATTTTKLITFSFGRKNVEPPTKEFCSVNSPHIALNASLHTGNGGVDLVGHHRYLSTLVLRVHSKQILIY